MLKVYALLLLLGLPANLCDAMNMMHNLHVLKAMQESTCHSQQPSLLLSQSMYEFGGSAPPDSDRQLLLALLQHSHATAPGPLLLLHPEGKLQMCSSLVSSYLHLVVNRPLPVSVVHLSKVDRP